MKPNLQFTGGLAAVANILKAILPDTRYVGKKCYTRDGKTVGQITGVSLCRLEGCGGTRLHVKWPDGKRTMPCVEGCRPYKKGFRIQ